jgi:hypothetical protein
MNNGRDSHIVDSLTVSGFWKEIPKNTKFTISLRISPINKNLKINLYISKKDNSFE